MLKGISPKLSPELLDAIYRMGHGEEIILADAHFPAHCVHDRVLRADGITIPELLDAILPLFELDSYDPSPLKMMAAVDGDTLDPEVERRYREVIDRHSPGAPSIVRIGRFEFYDYARSPEIYAVVVTGETSKYGNIILKKGVTPLG